MDTVKMHWSYKSLLVIFGTVTVTVSAVWRCEGGPFEVPFGLGDGDDRYDACTGLCYDVLPSNTQNKRDVMSDCLGCYMDNHSSCRAMAVKVMTKLQKRPMNARRKKANLMIVIALLLRQLITMIDSLMRKLTCVLSTKVAMLMWTRTVTNSVVWADLQVCGSERHVWRIWGRWCWILLQNFGTCLNEWTWRWRRVLPKQPEGYQWFELCHCPHEIAFSCPDWHQRYWTFHVRSTLRQYMCAWVTNKPNLIFASSSSHFVSTWMI